MTQIPYTPKAPLDKLCTTPQRTENFKTNDSSETKTAEVSCNKCKQSCKAGCTQIPLIMSQTVIMQPCYGAIHEITCICSFMLLLALHAEIEMQNLNLQVTLFVQMCRNASPPTTPLCFKQSITFFSEVPVNKSISV